MTKLEKYYLERKELDAEYDRAWLANTEISVEHIYLTCGKTDNEI